MFDCLKRRQNLQTQKKRNYHSKIQFYDFWEQEITDMWFYRFIQSRQLLQGSSKKICFFSTFGRRDTVEKVGGDINLFFTGENLKRGNYKMFADHLLNEKRINFAMGFEHFDDERYFRFPLWLLYMFEPESRDEDIVKRCAELNRPMVGNRIKFACHVSSGDELGLRERICNELSGVDQVDCAGKLLHNCDDLWNLYGNDKKRFLSNYRFNICPENSNADGYVTEKVFQAIEAGCIPIYWGDYNRPEYGVLNQDAILFWKEEDHTSLLDRVRKLQESSLLYKDFIGQNRLQATAADFVIDKFNRLESAIKDFVLS